MMSGYGQKMNVQFGLDGFFEWNHPGMPVIPKRNVAWKRRFPQVENKTDRKGEYPMSVTAQSSSMIDSYYLQGRLLPAPFSAYF